LSNSLYVVVIGMTLLRTLKYNIVMSFVHYFFGNTIGMTLFMYVP
jgi:hypothetical protein